MPSSADAVGQAVFLRTDTPDYAEQTVTFTSLEEMAKVCSQVHPNMILDKVIVYAFSGGEPVALTLGFVAATHGQRPDPLELLTS